MKRILRDTVAAVIVVAGAATAFALSLIHI